MTLSRRTLLTTASLGALAPLATALSLRAGVQGVFMPQTSQSDEDILVVIFLRFGSDGLTLVPPADDGLYHDNRRTTAISAKDALPIGGLDGTPFFFHPAITELKGFYDAGQLAVVHATGLRTESRSHFISQDKMDRGVTDGETPLKGGWLARHLMARDAAAALSAVSCQPSVDVSLQGFGGAMAVPDITLFNVVGGDSNRDIIKSLNSGAEPIVASASETIATIETVQARLNQMGDSTSAAYTKGPLSAALRSLATTIQLNMGLTVATVDFGGWDHHVDLNEQFPPQARELSQSIAAFWDDLKDYRHRLTILTMTEFGRRVKENANGGLDHGSASVMFAMGQHINGGQIYGQWPGLRPSDLHAGDLAVTTDYRQILQEVLVTRRRETDLASVFPTVPYVPLGLVKDARPK